MGIRKNIRLLYASHFGPLPKPDRWVFIVGCYNSGTTLLHDLLASHPEIGSMLREGQFYTDQLKLPKAVGLPRLWAIKPELFQMNEYSELGVGTTKLKRQWGAAYNDVTRPVLMEKSPTNAARTRWLQKHFRDAHFIGIIRNGYTVAEGIRRKAGHNLKDSSLQWMRSNSIMLKDFEHLRRTKLVRYEALTDQPDTCLHEILDFIGLKSESFSVEHETWSVHEKTSKIKNMNTQSLQSLSEKDYAAIEQVAGSMLKKLDYFRGPSTGLRSSVEEYPPRA